MVSGVDECEGDHRGRRITGKRERQRKIIREEAPLEGALLKEAALRQDLFGDAQFFAEVIAFGLFVLEIEALGVGKNEIQTEKSSSNIAGFVCPPVAKIILTNGGVDVSRTEVVHAVVGRMTLHGGMTRGQELVREVLAAVAAAGLDVGKKLPNGEVPRMGGRDVKKACFVFGVAESLKAFDVVCGQDHRLKIAALSSRSSRMRRNRSTSARRA